MRNLDLLKSLDFTVKQVGACRFSKMAIDTLTPEVYFAHNSGIVAWSLDGKLNFEVDLRAENILVASMSDGDSVCSLEFLVDEQMLFFATSSGNLCTVDCSRNIENVSLIHEGIETVAFSPDFDIVAVVSKNRTLHLMNREFQSFIETALDAEGFGRDSFITVGWGKKETQFHGTEGKEAARLKKEEAKEAVPYDDRKIRISWRGDGQFFAISSNDITSGARLIRIWTREGLHSTTTEFLTGLEQSLCWRPSGNLLASSQVVNDCRKIVFFERNGLPHGDFVLPLSNTKRVIEMSWNRDSNVLAVWLESIDSAVPPQSSLQFWTSGNYHWYLKKSFTFDESENLSMFLWDAENAYCVHVVTNLGHYFQFHFGFATLNSLNSDVVVIDGNQLLITSFSKSVVPPPMCNCALRLYSFCNFVAFSPNDDRILVVFDDWSLAILKKNSSDKSKNKTEEDWSLEKVFSQKIKKICQLSHFVWIADDAVFSIGSQELKNYLLFFSISDVGLTEKWTVELPHSVYQCAALRSKKSILVEFDNGSCLEINSEGISAKPTKSDGVEIRLPNACSLFDVVDVQNKPIIVALNERFQLFVDGKEAANNITSYCFHDKFLLLTTLNHKLLCVPIENLASANLLSAALSDARMVERGSRLVTAVHCDTKVVLQMPRGNLETIHPRALVVEMLKRFLDEGRYRETVLMMKRHRIDMNLIFDHNPEKFIKNVVSFVASVDDSQLFNLFISDLKEENVTKTTYAPFYVASSHISTSTKVNDVCKALRHAYAKHDDGRRYFTSFLMTFVKVRPAEMDNALQAVKTVRDLGGSSSLALVEDGLRHLLYVVDVNELIDVALGTYDFDLVLMVIEKSQKDPKEFLPYLNDLKQLSPEYRMYKIDVRLGRHVKALQHLVKCGKEKFDECLTFVKAQNLFVSALQMFEKGSNEHKLICSAYAAYLKSTKNYVESGIFFERSEEIENALESYRIGLCWQMFFRLAVKEQIEHSTVVESAEMFGEKLKDAKRYKEAADVFSLFAKNEEASIKCLLEGGLFEDANQKVIGYVNRLDWMESIFLPALELHANRLKETIENRRRTFEQYVQRLKIVRRSKREKFENALAHGDFDNPFDEVYSEVSTVASQSSAKSSRTKQSTAKKRERKKLSLKENSAFEDLALLNELNEIVKSVDHMQHEIGPILRSLLLADSVDNAKNLQRLLQEFIKSIEANFDEIWPTVVDLPLLPGPLHENILGLSEAATSEDILHRIQSRNMPDSIRLEPLLIRPVLRKDIKWTLEYLK